MAHIVVWDTIKHKNTEVIDLNVNETRFCATGLMIVFGYTGIEDYVINNPVVSDYRGR